MNPLISIVDDDDSVRKSLQRVLKSAGYESKCYGSALEFLENGRKSNCLLLDINMPGMSGLDLQKQLNEGKLDTPIVFITGDGDIHQSVQAIKAGATDFLEKPLMMRIYFEPFKTHWKKIAPSEIKKRLSKNCVIKFTHSLKESTKSLLMLLPAFPIKP